MASVAITDTRPFSIIPAAPAGEKRLPPAAPDPGPKGIAVTVLAHFPESE